MNLLGVRIDNLKQEEVLQKITEFLAEDTFHQIATVNPEFILTAQHDADFRKILASSDLNVADGVGIFFAGLWNGEILQARLTGVALVEEILQIANKNNLKVFLVASSTGLSTWTETRDAIHKIYPSLEISGVDLNKEDSSYKIPDAPAGQAKYQILICNFGAPEQEKFIDRVKHDKIRLAIGVGGSFDFLTGKIKRAPKIMQTIGLEWLWRFLQEPRYRAKRILRAVITFPIKIIFHQ